jgi:hypothetical protein
MLMQAADGKIPTFFTRLSSRHVIITFPLQDSRVILYIIRQPVKVGSSFLISVETTLETVGWPV